MIEFSGFYFSILSLEKETPNKYCNFFHFYFKNVVDQGFKTFIDQHSFSKGNDVLIELANLLKKQYNKSNVFRFGGDEFVIKLKDIEDFKSIELSHDIKLKYSMLDISVARNQSKKFFFNPSIMFYLEKAINESTEKMCMLKYYKETID